jgi:nucleotide-binding universal stress UspA family protein
MFKRILVAHDGSPGGWKAFEMGVELALEAGGALHVACIVGDEDLYAKRADATRDAWAESDSHQGGLVLGCESKRYFNSLTIKDNSTKKAHAN